MIGFPPLIGTIIAGLFVLAVAAAAVVKIVRDRKKRAVCGRGCAGCPYAQTSADIHGQSPCA